MKKLFLCLSIMPNLLWAATTVESDVRAVSTVSTATTVAAASAVVQAIDLTPFKTMVTAFQEALGSISDAEYEKKQAKILEISEDGTLCEAIMVGDLERIARIFIRGFDRERVVDVHMDYSGFKLLELALDNKHTHVVAWLLAHGADPDTMTSKWTVLHEAVRSGDKDMVAALLARGANVNTACTALKLTPLHIVCIKDTDANDQAIADLLLTYGAEGGVKNAQGATALAVAKNKNKPEIAAVFGIHGLDLTEIMPGSLSVMHGAPAVVAIDARETAEAMEFYNEVSKCMRTFALAKVGKELFQPRVRPYSFLERRVSLQSVRPDADVIYTFDA